MPITDGPNKGARQYRVITAGGQSLVVMADSEHEARQKVAHLLQARSSMTGAAAQRAVAGAHVEQGSVQTQGKQGEPGGSVRGWSPDRSGDKRWRVTFRDGTSVVVTAPNQSTAIHKAGADKRAQSHARRDMPLVGPTANDAARHEGTKVARVDPA